MTYLDTWYRGGAEVARADDVVTDAVSLFEEAELGNFAMWVSDIVQTLSKTQKN